MLHPDCAGWERVIVSRAENNFIAHVSHGEPARPGPVVAERPNVSVDIICKHIRTIKRGNAAATIDYAPRNGIALVGCRAVTVFKDWIDRIESWRRRPAACVRVRVKSFTEHPTVIA